MSKQTKETNYLCFHDWINWTNKLTLKNKTISYCLTLLIYIADPATFLDSNSVLGNFYSSESSLFIQN